MKKNQKKTKTLFNDWSDSMYIYVLHTAILMSYSDLVFITHKRVYDANDLSVHWKTIMI